MKDQINSLLKSVSRSFYLSLRVLPATLRPVMGLAYLFCRTADTVADTDLVSAPDRLALLERLRLAMSQFPVNATVLQSWASKIKEYAGTGITAEGQLLLHFDRAAAEFFRSSKTDQALIQEVVCAVIEGMKIDLTVFSVEGTIESLKTEEELDRYLTLIGGEPGRFWTKASLEHVPGLSNCSRSKMIEDGIAFGKGLQLVNILRKFSNDLRRGRCYIPLSLLEKRGVPPEKILEGENLDFFLPVYYSLIDEAVIFLRRGLDYIREIPRSEVRLRLAVWWPLIFGLRTLSLLRGTPFMPKEKRNVKIKRREVYRRMAGSLAWIWSNRFLRREFEIQARVADSGLLS